MRTFKAMTIAVIAAVVASTSAPAQEPTGRQDQEQEVDRRHIKPNAWPPAPGDRYYHAYQEGQAQIAQQEGQPVQERRGERYTALDAQQDGRCLRVSELIRADARGRTGEDLGHIEDLALDMDNLRVLYVVLAHGGVLGLGTEYFAIPCNELTPETTRRIRLPLARAELDDRNAFTGAESDWPKQADAYWLGAPPRGAEPRSAAVDNWHKASRLMDVDIENGEGRTLGEIEDIVIDAELERVAYILASREDNGRLMVAIPAAAMTIAPDRDVLLDMPVDQFNRFPTFTKDRPPNFNDLGWARQVHREFNVPVYWEEQTERYEIER